MNPESLCDNSHDRIEQRTKPKSAKVKMLASMNKLEQAHCGSGVCQVDWKPSPEQLERDRKSANSN